jgi:hypothetical protein
MNVREQIVKIANTNRQSKDVDTDAEWRGIGQT